MPVDAERPLPLRHFRVVVRDRRGKGIAGDFVHITLEPDCGRFGDVPLGMRSRTLTTDDDGAATFVWMEFPEHSPRRNLLCELKIESLASDAASIDFGLVFEE